MLKLDYISMVNIAADKALMPEFVQGEVTAEKLSAGLLPYFEDEKEREQSSRALLAQTGEMRGSEDETASARAAQAVLNMLS
jgi:lipid A disaccharide synthetase